MTSPKWQRVIAMAEKYPNADAPSLASLCKCDVRTVHSALDRKEAKHLKKTVEGLTEEYVDDIDLLVKQLRKLCMREDPDIRALNALTTVLDKTGKLNYNTKEEDTWQQRLEKMTPEELTLVATQKSTSSQKHEDKDALYQ